MPALSWPVEILDVTIRDGSYAIDFQFTQRDVRFLCATLERLRFRYIEIGHGFGLNAASVKGAAAATDDEYLGAAAESLQQARFGAFFIPGIGTRDHLRRARRDFGMHFIRIGDDPEKIERTAVPYIEYARELGYEVMANFMKSQSLPPAELARKAKVLAGHGAGVVYLVDSAGGMLPDEVAEYVKALAGECEVRLGFHGHNNLELAGANAIAAYRHGCTLLDCSIGGLGRSAGNTRTEMMLPILQRLGVAQEYDLLGVLHTLDQVIGPLLRHRERAGQHLLTGFAQLHSEQLGPFHELARQHGIRVEELLFAYGTGLARGAPEPLGQLASRLAGPAPGPALEHVLLDVTRRRWDAEGQNPRSWQEVCNGPVQRAADAGCRAGAQALVQTCAAVRAGEKVYVIADATTQAVADYVYLAAAERGAVLAYDLVTAGWMHGAEPSAAVAERMAWADVVFCLTPTSLAHTRARKRATDGGTRYLSLPDYSLELLASRSLQVDFHALWPQAQWLCLLLDSGRAVHVRTDAGTDLRFSIAGRTSNCCPGLCLEPGTLGSPPDAEVNIAPLEGTAEGMLWIDGSVPCRQLGRLREPLGLRIAAGSIVDIHGPAHEVRLLRDLFDKVRAPEAYVLAEFGLGLNPWAELTGRMLEDEGCAGTAHFGFGSNATIGGKNSVPFHLDFVLQAPYVWVDGIAILHAGQVVERRAAA